MIDPVTEKSSRVHREYKHPQYDLRATVTFYFTTDPFVSLYFEGRSVKKIRPTEYTPATFSGLFTRVDRVLREAKRYWKKQTTIRDRVTTQNKMLAGRVRRMGFTVTDERPGYPWAGIDAEYNGFNFYVTEKMEADFQIGKTQYTLHLQDAKEVIDVLQSNDLVPVHGLRTKS